MQRCSTRLIALVLVVVGLKTRDTGWTVDRAHTQTIASTHTCTTLPCSGELFSISSELIHGCWRASKALGRWEGSRCSSSFSRLMARGDSWDSSCVTHQKHRAVCGRFGVSSWWNVGCVINLGRLMARGTAGTAPACIKGTELFVVWGQVLMKRGE